MTGPLDHIKLGFRGSSRGEPHVPVRYEHQSPLSGSDVTAGPRPKEPWSRRSRHVATPPARSQLTGAADAAEARSPASSPLRTGRIWTVTVGLVGR